MTYAFNQIRGMLADCLLRLAFSMTPQDERYREMDAWMNLWIVKAKSIASVRAKQ